MTIPGVSNFFVFKSRLQEYAQKVGLSTPVYETIKEGPSHEPYFRSTVIVNDARYDSLPGFYNRKAAEQSAAEALPVSQQNGFNGKEILKLVAILTEDQCCSCSKNSLCKRSCKCRAAGDVCGPSCNCPPSKCTNREASSPKGSSKSAQLEEAEVISVSSGNEETEKSDSLVSHGAILLQNALADKAAGDDQDPRRKPLSDIGNTVAKSNAPRVGQKRKWKTATIQLVPTAHPSQPESRIDAAAPKRQEHETPEADISSMPSRAMQSAAMQLPNNNPLRERNSDHPEESAVVRKEHAGTGSQRGPVQQPRPSHEKENRKGQ